ncbi:unnamed protein product, partial [Staurois parvus]
MGPCTASHCCCLHRHTLPCATFRSPHTAGGFHFVIGCWQITGPPIAAARPVQSVSWVPVRPPIAASPSPHSAMCHFQVSSHCWWVPFCHRVLADYGPPIAA